VKVTGDSGLADTSMAMIAASQLILTTPEKLDNITRRWKEHIYLLGTIKLVMVDEIHSMTDKGRGATLESVVCRMKTVSNSSHIPITLPPPGY